MKIYDETKTRELDQAEIDYEKGYLNPDKIKTIHHEAVPAKTVDEQIAELTAQGVEIKTYSDKHYRVIRTYENGGKDVEPINEIPAQEAYDDYEDIQVYIPYTEEQLKEIADRKRYAELKAELAKVKEDIEQVEYGLVRTDYAEKKARAAEIINELRVLEGKAPREINAEIL